MTENDKQCCGNCRFRTTDDAAHLEAGGMCRRHAPREYRAERALGVPVAIGEYRHEVIVPWPAAYPNHWCGEWEGKP